MATLIGKVGMVMKGDWSSSATYEALDAVSYNNGTYIAKQAVPANTLPTNTTYWQPGLVASSINGEIGSPKNLYASSLVKTGKIVTLYLEIYPLNTLDNSDVIGIVAEGFRPLTRRATVIIATNAYGTDVAGRARVEVTTGGEINFTKMPDLITTGNGFASVLFMWTV